MNKDFLMPLITMLPLLGSRLINWQGHIVGSDNVRGYKNIRHRSQQKLRRLARQHR